MVGSLQDSQPPVIPVSWHSESLLPSPSHSGVGLVFVTKSRCDGISLWGTYWRLQLPFGAYSSSLGSLAVGNASCHMLRMFRQPCGEPHAVETLQPLVMGVNFLVNVLSSSSQGFRWWSPSLQPWLLPSETPWRKESTQKTFKGPLYKIGSWLASGNLNLGRVPSSL